MYIWVVLATFLAILAGYILPVKSDMDKIEQVPVADAKLMQIVVEHDVAVKYVKSLTTRSTGYLADDDLTDYMPLGFSASSEYVTQVYCLDDAGIIQVDGGCSSATQNYVVTYGAIPLRWRKIYEPEPGIIEYKPSSYLIAAMRKRFGDKDMFGYTMANAAGGYDIINAEGMTFTIDSNILDYKDAAITEIRAISDCISDNGSCLVYMTKF